MGGALIANTAQHGQHPIHERGNDGGSGRATLFVPIHRPSTWAALFGDQSLLGADKPDRLVEWTVTRFAVPLLTAGAGFLAWRQTGR